MSATILDFTTFKQARARLQYTAAQVLTMYKSECYDWCGHDLACQLVAVRTGIAERLIRNIVADAGVIF